MSDDILGSLLDSTLDDLKDLPSFKPYPIGGHQVFVTFEPKEVNKKKGIEVQFKYISVVQLVNADDVPPEAGDECSIFCDLENEYGQGNFKAMATPFAEKFGTTSLRQVVEQVKAMECVIVTGLRSDKNDADKKYLQVKELAVL